MRYFDYSRLSKCKWDMETVNLLSMIHEAKGHQQLYLKQKEETLDRLVELAKVRSTESSNAIEGIRTTETRLKQLMSEKTTPKNRDESEIIGYRDALNLIHESFDYIPITSGYILQLHKIMFSHTNNTFGGKFKNVQNYISATDVEGRQFILFTPLKPYETPEAMKSLCDAFNIALGEGIVDPLILIPVFIHDFLCIHPFIDGNGRMSRLLTTLLLYRSGYFIGRYISLEAKIAANKDSYYNALQVSQSGWHEGTDDPLPFIKYLLGTLISAYRDFEDRVEIISEREDTITIVRNAVRQKIGPFKKTDICELCPSLSASSVERSLRAMCENGELRKEGAGRATHYIRMD